MVSRIFSAKSPWGKARSFKPEIIDIRDAHSETVRGQLQVHFETWTVNEDEKTNLCSWLCENGTFEIPSNSK